MNTPDLTTIDSSTHLISLGIVLFIAFCLAVIFAGMVFGAGLASDEEDNNTAFNTSAPEDEDNVIFRS
jgi:hypothetical protein